MKYLRNIDGGWCFDRYEAYLSKNGDELRARIDGEDLLDMRRLSLSDRGSLHDARFVKLAIEPSDDVTAMVLWLRGPYFDRFFRLEYRDVEQCSLSAPRPTHDLLIHEVRLEDGGIVHELFFDGDHTILVECGRIEFREVLSDSPNAPSMFPNVGDDEGRATDTRGEET